VMERRKYFSVFHPKYIINTIININQLSLSPVFTV